MPAPAKLSLIALAALALSASPAAAYVGPGLGVAAIGAVLGGIAAVLLAIVGIFWYPIKSMLKKRKAAKAEDAGAEDAPE
jgi:hypothetical protein